MEKQFIAVIIIFILIAVTVVIFLVKALLKNMEKYRAALETVNNLEQLNARMRSQRHDYINQMQVIYGLLELEEYDEALDYLKPIFTDMMKVGKALKTKIPAVNALLMAKMQTAEKQNIDMYVEVKSNLENIGVEGWELCKVMSNIIDNSIAASLQSEYESRKVYIEISESIDSYIIRIGNNGQVLTADDKKIIFKSGYSTKKEPGHGEGLAIVMNILKKYNAKIKVDSSDKETFFEIEFVKKGDGLL